MVASYAGGEVTVGEVEDAIGTATSQTLAELSSEHMVRHWYEQTLRQELLLSEAQRRDYAKNPHVHQRIAQLGIDMMLAGVVGEPLKTFNPSEEALQEFFKTRQADLTAPELRRVIELVVATEAEARALLPKFQSAQPDVQKQLIKQHSLDVPSRNDDGYSRYFDRAGMLDDRSASVDPALASAAFALTGIGATSDVVVMGGGAEKRFAPDQAARAASGVRPDVSAKAVPVMKKLMTDERREQGRAELEQAAHANHAAKVRFELLDEPRPLSSWRPTRSSPRRARSGEYRWQAAQGSAERFA